MGMQDHVESYEDGDIIVREGEESREMYVIQRGSVVVTKVVDGREIELATLPRGSFFGEMSLLESLPRNATVRVVGQTRLLVIKPGSLLLRFRRDPTFAFEMLQHMSRRLRELDDRLVRMIAERNSQESVQLQMRIDHATSEYRQAAERESPEPVT